MTTLPTPSLQTLFQHFIYAAQPFWCHRHTVSIPSGTVYDVGDFRVRIGDVRQTQPSVRVRGTVVDVEWRGPSLVRGFLARPRQGGGNDDDDDDDDDGDSGIEMLPRDITVEDIDAEYGATAGLIREFWARFGVEGAREAIIVPDLGREIKERLGRWKEGKKLNDGEVSGVDDDDPIFGADLARQLMEIFRFNR